MVEPAGGSRFLLESSPTIRIIRKRRRQNFDCDVAAELLVVCTVDLAHTTRPERADDLEAAKSITHRKSHTTAAIIATVACRHSSSKVCNNLRLLVSQRDHWIDA